MGDGTGADKGVRDETGEDVDVDGGDLDSGNGDGADERWRQHWGRPEEALARAVEVLRTPGRT